MHNEKSYVEYNPFVAAQQIAQEGTTKLAMQDTTGKVKSKKKRIIKRA